MFFSHQSQIGIDISDNKMRLVVLRSGTRHAQLQALGEINVPASTITGGIITQNEQFVTTLKNLLHQVRGHTYSRTSIINVSLPEQQTYVATVPMTAQDTRDIDELAARAIPFERDQMYFNTEIIKEHKAIMIGAGRKEFIDHYLELFKQCDLEPSGLYPETVAIANALLPSKLSEAGIVIADIGSARTTISLVVHNSIHFTTSYPTIEAQDGVHLDHLLGALQQVIRYYNDHLAQFSPLSKILLCGSGAYTETITEVVAQGTTIPTELGNMFQHVRSDHRTKKIAAPLTYATAIGLAIMKV